MSDHEHREIFIIKRHPNHDEGYHGGAWKIAFADFMTAMMALFLVLWLISSTSDKTKHAVAQYFNPVKLVDMTTLKRGFRDPLESEMGPLPNVKESRVESDSHSRRPSSGTKEDAHSQTSAAAAVRAEAALFRDPFAVLAEIAARAPAESPDALAGAASGFKANRGDPAHSFEDPFAATPRESERGALPASTPDESAEAHSAAEGTGLSAVADPGTLPQSPIVKALQQPKAGPHPGPVEATPQSGAADAAKLKMDIIEALKNGLKTQDFPRMEVQDTAEGILISLTDDNNYSMFAVGSAEPLVKTVQVMEKVGLLLKMSSGSIVIRGHTDGRPFKSAAYDNWRLSSARAQMALYMLVRGGLSKNRVEKVEGYADRHLKAPKNPFSSENRRIEILLRKD